MSSDKLPETSGSGNTPSTQSDSFRAAIQEAVNNLSGTVHFPRELESIRSILSSEKVKKAITDGILGVAHTLVTRTIKYNEAIQIKPDTKPIQRIKGRVNIVFDESDDIKRFQTNTFVMQLHESRYKSRSIKNIPKRAMIYLHPELQNYSIPDDIFIDIMGGSNNDQKFNYNPITREFSSRVDNGGTKTAATCVKISFDFIKVVTESDSKYVNELLQSR